MTGVFLWYVLVDALLFSRFCVIIFLHTDFCTHQQPGVIMSHLKNSALVISAAAAALALAGCGSDSDAGATSTVTVTSTPKSSAVVLREGPDFTVCGDRAGAGTTVTSCPFSINVARDYLTQSGSEVTSWSDPMNDWYDMYCRTGYAAQFANGDVVDAARCTGGINAVVIVFMY